MSSTGGYLPDELAEWDDHSDQAWSRDLMKRAAARIVDLESRLSTATIALKHLSVVRAMGDDEIPESLRDWCRDVVRELETRK